MENLGYLAIFCILLYMITKHFLYKIRKYPPTPFFNLPIIGHLYLLRYPLRRTLAKISAHYGPVVFLEFGSRPVLLVSSPSTVRDCFTTNDVVFANRPKLVAGKHVGRNYTTLEWSSYGHHWQNLRRIASLEIFSTTRVETFTSIRSYGIHSLVSTLHEGSHEGRFKTVNMKLTFFDVTLNNIMWVLKGRRSYGESVGESGAREFREIVEDTFRLSGTTNLEDLVPMVKWFGLNQIEKKLERLMPKWESSMQEIIEEHRRMRSHSSFEASKSTIIDVLLSLQETQPEYYSDEIIRGLAQVMINGGTDTAAGTLEWALSLLLNHPESLKKAVHEIDMKVGSSRFMDESDLSSLPYLHGVIKETLRMCPPATVLPPHESSQECVVGGFRVPRGTMLLVNIWAIQNDPDLWEDPDRFKPERFTDNKGKIDGFKFMPFGSGRRGCPGEGLAGRMVGLTLGTLLQCFEWERVGEEKVDMSESSGLNVQKAHPLVAKYRPRPVMVDLLSQIKN